MGAAVNESSYEWKVLRLPFLKRGARDPGG